MRTFNITVNGQTYVVDVEEVGGVQTAAPVRAAAPVAVVNFSFCETVMRFAAWYSSFR